MKRDSGKVALILHADPSVIYGEIDEVFRVEIVSSPKSPKTNGELTRQRYGRSVDIVKLM